MSLRSWQEKGWLHKHPASREDVVDLLALADRDLAQCQTRGLSPDWQLAIAYNAALQCATAALAACAYRVRRGTGHHYRTIQSLELTLGWDADTVSVLDGFREKRHTAEYARSGSVSAQEARQMLELARKLRDELQAWLEAHHPTLV